jgi:uncharacterized delta-60 repeat protein
MTAPAHAGPGDLDVRFGTHGQAVILGQVDSAALVTLPDGRILVFGVPDVTAVHQAGSIAVTRLLANGTPDAAFSPGGHKTVSLGSTPRPVPTAALLLGDGRILLAGYFAADGWAAWPYDAYPVDAPGWLVRLSSDAMVDPTFGAPGTGGVVRPGPPGISRVALLGDGSIAAAGQGLLRRFDANGVPAFFPGSEVLTVALGNYPVTALAPMQDEGLLASVARSDGWDYFWRLSRISASGVSAPDWGHALYSGAFTTVAGFARTPGDPRIVACGSTYTPTLIVQRWQDDGTPDPTFAGATDGQVELGVEERPDFLYFGSANCRAILTGSAADEWVIGDWNRPFEYGNGHLLLAHLDAQGTRDNAFDPSGNGRELALGSPDQWSQWLVADATLAPDGAALLIARGVAAAGDGYDRRLQRNVIARVELSSSRSSAGSIGFNDAEVRIAERQPGEVHVYRSGGTAGVVSTHYEMVPESAGADDMAPVAGTLTWSDGDASARTIPLTPIDDDATEGEETFRVRLSSPTGGASLGAPEIRVTIEDDEALQALQFAAASVDVKGGSPVDLTVTRPQATPGPILVRYVAASRLGEADGAPSVNGAVRLVNTPAGTLRWSAGDTSSRTVRVRTYAVTDVETTTAYVALADVAGTLPAGTEWKFARVRIVQGSGGASDPPPPAPPPPPASGGGGGGALSFEALVVLALALLLGSLRKVAAVLRPCGADRRAVHADCGDAALPVLRAPGSADRP